MSTLQEVFEAAQSLPADERAWLVHALWDSMQPSDWPPLGEEWAAEVQRRSRQIDEGRMTLSSWSEVRERARRKAGLNG
jgi:putative addiction module component (TIGR02574 family)